MSFLSSPGACIFGLPFITGMLLYTWGLLMGWYPFWSGETAVAACGLFGLMFFGALVSSGERDTTDTFDDNISIDDIEATITQKANGQVHMHFPTKGLSYNIHRSKHGVVVEKIDNVRHTKSKPVLYGTKSYRFGSNPDRSAAEAIKREVYYADDVGGREQ